MFKKTMFRNIILFAAILVLPVLAAGCACTGTPAATPVPTNSPMASPTVEIVETSPEAILPAESSASPDAQSSPGAMTSPDAAASPDAQGTGTGTGSIANFSEGTEVEQSAVPELVAAIKEKYENAEIRSIKHATQNGEQVYAVEVKSGATTKTVYVRADGTIIE